MKRLAIVFLLLCSLLFVAAGWIREVTLTGTAKQKVERLLAGVLKTPLHFSSLRVSALPLLVEVRDLAVGDQGLVEIGGIHLQLLVLASIREGRPVVIVKVDSPMIDLSLLPPDEDDDDSGPPTDLVRHVPPLRVSEMIVERLHLRFRMGKDPVDIRIDSLTGSLHRPLLRRAVDLNLVLTGGDWRRKGFRFDVDTLSTSGGMDPDGVWVERLVADGPDLHLSANSSNVPHRQEAVADFKAALLGAFVDELGEIDGVVHAEGEVSGNVIDPYVDARLEVSGGGLAGHPIGDLGCRFLRKRSLLRFENVRVKGEVGEAAGTVELVAYHETPLSADLRWEHLNLQGLLRVIGPEVPFHNFLDGQTVLSGTLDPLDLQIRGTGSGQPIEPEHAMRVAEWKANARVRPTDFDATAVVTQQGNRVTARLGIHHADLDGHIEADIEDLDALAGFLPQPVPQLLPTGRGIATVELSGTVHRTSIHGQLHVQDASISGTAVQDLHGEVTIADGRLTTPELSFLTGGGSGTLTGTIALTPTASNDWKLVLQEIDTNLVTQVARELADIEVPVRGGSLSSTVTCASTWPTAKLDADLRVRATSIVGEAFDLAEGTMRAALPTWDARVRLQHGPDEEIRIQGRGRTIEEGDINFDSDSIRLRSVQLLGLPDLRGEASTRGHLVGRWQSLSGSLDLKATGLAWDRHALGDMTITANGQNGLWRLQARGLDRRFVADASLKAAMPFPYSLGAKLEGGEVTNLLLQGDSARLWLGSTLELSGDLSKPANSKGQLQIDGFRLQRDPHVVEAIAPFVFQLENGRVAIRALEVQSLGSRLSVGGSILLSGDLDLDVRGDGDLVLLELLELPVVAARGPFSVHAAVRYSPSTGWKLMGEGNFQDAVLDFGLPVAFTRANGVFHLREHAVLIESAEARAGGGQLRLAGRIDLVDGPAIEWKATDVGFSPGDGLEVKVTGQGKVDGDWDRPRISGSIEIPNALYDQNFDWKDVLPWLLEQVAGRSLPRVRSLDRPIGLDLIVYSRGGVFVDNNLANVEMWLDLQVLGDTRTPIISGRIGFLDGEVYLRGRKFSITGGTVDFRDYYRNDPLINITCDGRVTSSDSDYGLTIVISGTASHPRIRFSSSDPTLSQTDVLSLATFGKTGAQLQREGGGVSPADALALVPTGEIEKRVGQLVGFDRFQIEAVQSRSTGAIEPRVTIGKELTENLRALLWTSFGLEQRRSVQLEYRLSRNVSLLGAWESDTRSQAGAFGGDVKFRFEFRRVRFSLLSELDEAFW